MDFDQLLIAYFGTTELDSVGSPELEAGTRRLQADFLHEKDRDRRFTSWSILYMLGTAPDLDAAFTEPADRALARDFMLSLARAHRTASTLSG